MGGGDLNLKKSWHTGLLSNQRKVWEAEQAAVAERKKIEQVRREREEERQLEELDRLAEANGGPKRKERVGWMYTGAETGTQGATEEREAFLLGKRRVVVKDEPLEGKVEKKAVDSILDVKKKVDMDPLTAIERQQQENLERAIARQQKMAERAAEREEKRDKKSRRHRDHRDHRESRRHRSPSASRHRRHSDDDRGEKRRRNRSYSRERSRSPARKKHRSRHDGERRDDRDRSRSRHDGDRKDTRDRSRSPYRRPHKSYGGEERPRHSEHHRHRYASASPDRRRDRYERSDRRDKDRSALRPREDRDRSRSPYRNNRPRFDRRDNRPAPPARPEQSREDAAAKLAAMKADASSLELDREKRLAAMDARDAEEKALEDQKRGRGVDFKAKMYQQAEGVGLSDRLKGNRRLLQT